MPFETSEERNRWLPRYLGLYNGRRCHMALGGLSPQQCLQQLLLTE
jgi:transposase InsO family protein